MRKSKQKIRERGKIKQNKKKETITKTNQQVNFSKTLEQVRRVYQV